MNSKIVLFPINQSNFSIYVLLKKYGYDVVACSFIGSSYVGFNVGTLVNNCDYEDSILDIFKYEFKINDVLLISEVIDTYINTQTFEMLLDRVLKLTKNIIYYGSNDKVMLLLKKNNSIVNESKTIKYTRSFIHHLDQPNMRFKTIVPTIFVMGFYDNYERDIIGLLIKKHIESYDYKVLCYTSSKDSQFFNSFTYSPSFMKSTTSPSDQVNELNDWFYFLDEIIQPDINICVIPNGLYYMDKNYDSSKGIYLDMIKNLLNPNYLIFILSDIIMNEKSIIRQLSQIESHIGISVDCMHESNAVFSGVTSHMYNKKPMYTTPNSNKMIKNIVFNNHKYKMINLMDDENIVDVSKQIISKFSNDRG